MLPVNLNDLTFAHIEDLIESEVPESLTLDYKQELPPKKSDSKKSESRQRDAKQEFLYDVVAMANAAGGDLVYGVAERRLDRKTTGIPGGLSGIRFENAQEEEIRLSNYIRNGITPKLIGTIVRSVRCDKGDALVVRIPASRSKPHMVTVEGVDRFYKRTGTVSQPMSWEEIRRAFSEQGELREAIARWRAHRLDLIEQKRGPIPLQGEAAMLFHIIPAEAFTPGMLTETWRLPPDEKEQIFVPYGNHYRQYNADGFLCHSSRAVAGPPQKTDGYWGYAQLFRSGIVEYGFSHFYRPPSSTQGALIQGQEVEQVIVQCYEKTLGRFRREGRTGIVYVGFSMVGIEDKQIFATDSLLSWGQALGIRQNTFTSPEVMVDLAEQDESPYARILHPLVDTFWQLDGREGTPFILDGRWNPFARYQ